MKTDTSELMKKEMILDYRIQYWDCSSGIHLRTGKVPVETSHTVTAKVHSKDKEPKEWNYITRLGQQPLARLGCCMDIYSTIRTTPREEMGPKGHLDSEDTPEL